MNRSMFLAHYPEFLDTDARLVDAKLAQAAARMGGPDTSVWGSFAAPTTPPAGPPQPTIADLAQGNLAAHLLVTTPFGTAFKLDDAAAGKKTPYWAEYEVLLESVAGGAIVAGGPVIATAGGGAPPPALVFSAGLGNASVTNGSTAVSFTLPVTLAAGTLVVFASQPGGVYSVAIGVVGGTAVTLAAPYSGVTSTSTTWTHT